VIFGISAALYGEITLKNGRVEQSNFDNYQVVRISEAPAIANAIFAATGKRPRKLPIDPAGLKQPA
jgi:isoquinoline 1-oxidoreductase beta subunit